MKPAAPQVLSVFEKIAGGSLPARVSGWDGSVAGPRSAPVSVRFRRRRALRRILWSPNEVGLGRAYVSGDREVDGDLFALLDQTDVLDRGSTAIRAARQYGVPTAGVTISQEQVTPARRLVRDAGAENLVQIRLLHLTASAVAFERGRTTVNQMLAVRTGERGTSALPRTRAEWLGGVRKEERHGG